MSDRPRDARFNPLAAVDPKSPVSDMMTLAEAIIPGDGCLPSILDLLGSCALPLPPKGPPEMEALLDTAAHALGDLLRLMEAAPEPYMEANADIIREAWCSLEVVSLTGPPLNAPD